jgi:hypothetical protein
MQRADIGIIGVSVVQTWPRVKIHQISLEQFMPFLHESYELEPDEIHEGSSKALDSIWNRIEAEYGATITQIRGSSQ